MFPQITQVQLGLVQINLHDVVVKQINGRWLMLLSYWDGGYVQLNVDNPAAPTLIGDTDYNNPDPELLESAGVSLLPEGNGHQAEFTADNRFFIATDEDFAPYGATHFEIASGLNAGTYPSVPVPGSTPIVTLADERLNGPVVYGGYREQLLGVEAFVRDGKTIILGSDRDSGLWCSSAPAESCRCLAPRPGRHVRAAGGSLLRAVSPSIGRR
jgi:hypothetical protein